MAGIVVPVGLTISLSPFLLFLLEFRRQEVYFVLERCDPLLQCAVYAPTAVDRRLPIAPAESAGTASRIRTCATDLHSKTHFQGGNKVSTLTFQSEDLSCARRLGVGGFVFVFEAILVAWCRRQDTLARRYGFRRRIHSTRLQIRNTRANNFWGSQLEQ